MQSLALFVGEFCCLAIYGLMKWRDSKGHEERRIDA